MEILRAKLDPDGNDIGGSPSSRRTSSRMAGSGKAREIERGRYFKVPPVEDRITDDHAMERLLVSTPFQSEWAGH